MMISQGTDSRHSEREQMSSPHPTTHPGALPQAKLTVPLQARKPERDQPYEQRGRGPQLCHGTVALELSDEVHSLLPDPGIVLLARARGTQVGEPRASKIDLLFSR